MKKFLVALFIALAVVFALFLSFKPTSKGELSCPFCQKGVIDSHLFYRGREVLAILTHKPAVPGHVLVIPERHVERFEELSVSEIAEMGEVIKKVDIAVKSLHGTTGYLLLQKNGQESGQSVPHVHFHYLPTMKEGSQTWVAIRFFISPLLAPLTFEEMRPEIEALQESITHFCQ